MNTGDTMYEVSEYRAEARKYPYGRRIAEPLSEKVFNFFVRDYSEEIKIGIIKKVIEINAADPGDDWDYHDFQDLSAMLQDCSRPDQVLVKKALDLMKKLYPTRLDEWGKERIEEAIRDTKNY